MFTIISNKKLNKLLTLKASNKRAEIINYLMENYDNFAFHLWKDECFGNDSIEINIDKSKLKFEKVKDVNELKKLIKNIISKND